MRGWLNSNWLDLLISILIAVIDVAIITPWIVLLLRSAGEESIDPMLPIGVGIIGVVSYWVARELLSQAWDLAAMRMASLGVWLGMIVIWFGLVFNAGISAPLELVDRLFSFETGALGLLFLGAVAWWRGLWLASTEDLYESEFVRAAVMRPVVLQALVLVVAALFWDNASSPIQAIAIYMIPLGFSACLIAATAIQIRTARLNIRAELDQRLPGRGWLLTGAGISGGILLLAALVAGTAGREAWQLLIWPFAQLLRGLSWLLDWIILGLALIGYFLLLPLFWVVQQLVEDAEQEDFTQETGGVLEPAEELPEQTDVIPEVVLQVLQWVAVAVIIGLVIWFGMRQLKRLQGKRRDEGEAEVRESMFSTEALLGDLKAMLSGLRHGWMSRRARFNLRSQPETVRDAYQHVIVHAGREGIPRDERESPRQYSSRLSASRPDLNDPIDDLTERYMRARYGDLTSDEDVRLAREDWEAIRQRLRRQRAKE
ncbi:MAG: DUF4129 domain-containing protein [Thermomicrobiaceae bacterium]